MPKNRQKEHKGNNRQILCRPRRAGVSEVTIFLATVVTMTGTTVRTVRYDRHKGRTVRTVRNDRSFDRTHAKIKL